MNTCYSEDFSERNCRLAWDQLSAKFLPSTTSLLFTMYKVFASSKLDSSDKDPGVWNTKLKALRQMMGKIGLEEKMSDMEFMILLLNNLLEEYNVVLDSLESCLVSTSEDTLTLKALWEKLNSRFQQISLKERENDCHKKALAARFNLQFKGACCKCGQYGHKPDSPQ